MHAYVEGLCWIARYYFTGVASWSWYYRYHYAPFASDLATMAGDGSGQSGQSGGEDGAPGSGDPRADDGGDGHDGFTTWPFNKGQPFQPCGQLLGVLPPYSATLLPHGLRALLTASSSPLKEYIPDTLDIGVCAVRGIVRHVLQADFVWFVCICIHVRVYVL